MLKPFYNGAQRRRKRKGQVNRGEPTVAHCYDKQQPQQMVARSQTALVIIAIV